MSQFEEILDPGDVADEDDLLFKIDNINKSFSHSLISQNFSVDNNDNNIRKFSEKVKLLLFIVVVVIIIIIIIIIDIVIIIIIVFYQSKFALYRFTFSLIPILKS